MTHERHATRRRPTEGTSTARALGLASVLIVVLLAATTGVLAGAGAFGSSSPSQRVEPALPTRQAGQPLPIPGPGAPGGSGGRDGQPAPDAAQERQSAPAAGAGRLVAFGATVLDWGANHRVDNAVGGSSAFNPDTALGGDDRLADRYVRVLALNGRILQYTLQLPRSTGLAVASTTVLAELPRDLRTLWQQTRANCKQAAYVSPTLATFLADVGDSRGSVLVEYRSGVTAGSAWNPDDVTNATLSALDTPTPADAPPC
ncbi:MAG: hypothetical protein QOI74_4048 [Micromonosporaceae bacterium]|jgi:hypothetical protein|nr:hypothetical protein [Micromonosporaceae bacterium]